MNLEDFMIKKHKQLVTTLLDTIDYTLVRNTDIDGFINKYLVNNLIKISTDTLYWNLLDLLKNQLEKEFNIEN